MLTELIHKKTKIHTRDICLATYPHKGSTLIVHGILKDQRHIRVFDVAGDVKEPGIIHHMDVKLLIASDPLRIELAEASMLQVPLDQCRETLDTAKGLKGVEIKSGFSGQVRKIVGGKNGCTHLCHLVTAMGQEIVHGWLTQKRSNKAPLPKNLESLSESRFLIDSCRMWTRNGPKMNGLARAIAAQTGQPS